MDIITNRSAVAPQMLAQEVRSAAPVAKGGENIPSGQAKAAATGQVQAPTEQDKQTLEEAVVSMQDATQAMQRNLDFSIDESSGRMVVKVTDSASGDVIRQMPTEEALRLAESLDEMRSLLFKAQA